MKWLILTLLLLVACSHTQTLYYNQPVQEQTVTTVQTSNVQQNITQTTANNTMTRTNNATGNNQDTTTQQTTISTKNTNSTSIVNETQFNPAEEYKIISCCQNGELIAETTRQNYTENQIEDLLINIYYDNCNNLKKYNGQQILLKVKGETFNNRLGNYPTSGIKQMSIRNRQISPDFESCS